MQHKIVASICRHMDERVSDFEKAEVIRKIAEERIMVAGCQSHLRTRFPHFQQSANDAGIDRLPMPSFLESPAVEYIAGQIEIFRFDCRQKVEQCLRLCIRTTKVGIADKDTTNSLPRA